MVKAELEELKANKTSAKDTSSKKKQAQVSEPKKAVETNRQKAIVEDELVFENSAQVSSAPELNSPLSLPDVPDSKQAAGIKERLLGKMKDIVTQLEATKSQLAMKESETVKLLGELARLKEKIAQLESSDNYSFGKGSGNNEKELKELKKKVGEKDLEIKVLKNSQQEKNKKIEGLTKDLRDAGFEIHDLTKRLREASDIGGKSPEAGKLQLKIKQLEEELNLAKSKAQKPSSDAEVGTLLKNPEVGKLQLKINQLEDDLRLANSKAQKPSSDIEHEIETKKLTEQIDSLKFQLKNLESLNSAMKYEIESLKVPKSEDGKDRNHYDGESLKIEISKLNREIQVKNDQIGQLANETNENQSEIKKLINDKNQLNKDLLDTKAELKKQKESLVKNESNYEKLSQITSENKDLKKKQAEFESQKHLVRELKSQIRNLEDSLEDSRSNMQKRQNSGQNDGNRSQEIAYLRNKIEVLESEKEDLEFTLNGMQNQIRAGAFKNLSDSGIVSEESTITVEKVETVKSEVEFKFQTDDSPSNTIEHSSVDFVKGLEEQVKNLEKKNFELNKKLEDGFDNFKNSVVTNLDNLYKNFGGSPKKQYQNDINEYFKAFATFLKLRIEKKDLLLKELNGENEKLAEKLRGLQARQSSDTSQMEEFLKCKEIVHYYAKETGLESQIDQNSFLNELTTIFEAISTELKHARESEKEENVDYRISKKIENLEIKAKKLSEENIQLKNELAHKENQVILTESKHARESEKEENVEYKSSEKIENLEIQARKLSEENNQLKKELVQKENQESEHHFQMEELNQNIKVLQFEISDLRKNEPQKTPQSDENDSKNTTNNADFEVELQHTREKVCTLLQMRNIGLDDGQDLESLVLTLYEDLVSELEREKDVSWHERNENRMLLQRLDDSEMFYDDAIACQNILRRLLSKYNMLFSNSSTLEELASQMEALTERIKNQPTQQPIQARSSIRGRSLTSFLKGSSKLVKKSKSSQNLKGSQMSIASSYMSPMGSEHPNSSGIFNEFSKLSTEQLKASMENMHENQLQEVDEIKVNLYEILKVLNKAPEYPKPSLQMVKMIRSEVENRNSQHQEESNERERKISGSEMYVQELRNEQNEIHSNLYALLRSAGFEPDPSANSGRMSEIALTKVNEKLVSLRRVAKDFENDNQDLENQNLELKNQLNELKMKNSTENNEVLGSVRAPEPINSPSAKYANLDNNAQLYYEIDMLKQDLSGLQENLSEKEGQFQQNLTKVETEKEDLRRLLKDQEKQSAQIIEKNSSDLKQALIKLEEENEDLKYSLEAEKRKSVNESLKQSISETASAEKISLMNRIKVLEGEVQKSSSAKVNKEAELQEQVLSLIDQNTKLIETKKQLRAEIKALRQQSKDSPGSRDSRSDNAEEKLRSQIESVEDELQSLKDQNAEGSNQNTTNLEDQLNQERSKVTQLQKELSSLTGISQEPGKTQSLERNLVAANAKLMGQTEMMKRLQMQMGDMKKLEIKVQQLEMENEILISKLEENEVEDMTSIRYAFDQLVEDLDIKLPAEDLGLADQMENAFEIIKKRNRSMASKKVTFNPNLTSTSILSGKKSAKIKTKTWPKGESGDSSGAEDELSLNINYQQLIDSLESKVKLQESEITQLKESKGGAETFRGVLIRLLSIIDGPQLSRTKNYASLDTETLIGQLENSIVELIQQREVELPSLSDINVRYSRPPEQTYERGGRSQSASNNSRNKYQGSLSASNLSQI